MEAKAGVQKDSSRLATTIILAECIVLVLSFLGMYLELLNNIYPPDQFVSDKAGVSVLGHNGHAGALSVLWAKLDGSRWRARTPVVRTGVYHA